MRDKVIAALLILNLFASLWVYRGMQVLVERIDRPECMGQARSDLGGTPFRGAGAQQGMHAATETPTVTGDAVQAEQEASENTEDKTLPEKDAWDASIEAGNDTDAAMTADIGDLKHQFEAQYSDSVWTAQVHQAIQKVAASSVNYSGITQDLVACKEKVCKLAIGYSDSAVFEDFVSHLGTSFKGGQAPVSLYFDEPKTVGGNSTVDVYLVRQ